MDGGLSQRVLRLWQADPFQRAGRRHCQLQGVRISIAHIFGGADDQSPSNELGILPCRNHRSQPVQRRVRVVAAQTLDEGTDRVVVAVAGTVVGQHTLLSGRLDFLQRRLDHHARGLG